MKDVTTGNRMLTDKEKEWLFSEYIEKKRQARKMWAKLTDDKHRDVQQVFSIIMEG